MYTCAKRIPKGLALLVKGFIVSSGDLVVTFAVSFIDAVLEALFALAGEAVDNSLSLAF